MWIYSIKLRMDYPNDYMAAEFAGGDPKAPLVAKKSSGMSSTKTALLVGGIISGLLIVALLITIVVYVTRKPDEDVDEKSTKTPGGNKTTPGGNTTTPAGTTTPPTGNTAPPTSTPSTPPAPTTPAVPVAPKHEYVSRGCYADASKDRALRIRVPGFSYADGPAAIKRCADITRASGSKIFGIQTGGECWNDSDPTRDYKKYGMVECSSLDGTGAPYVNNIYELL